MLITSLRILPDSASHRRDGSYIWELPAVRHLDAMAWLRFQQPVTVFAGGNGAGKSTLLEAIALKSHFGAVGGRIADPKRVLSTGTESTLHRSLEIDYTEPIHRGFYLRSETHSSMLNALGTPEEMAGRNQLAQELDLEQRSHGESLFDILGEHVDGRGLYIFDEPEAGLSVIRQMALLAEIDQAVKRGAQFFIATHSPVLMAVPHSEILEVGPEGIMRREFEETEAVSAMREFLNDVPGTVEYLTQD